MVVVAVVGMLVASFVMVVVDVVAVVFIKMGLCLWKCYGGGDYGSDGGGGCGVCRVVVGGGDGGDSGCCGSSWDVGGVVRDSGC